MTLLFFRKLYKFMDPVRPKQMLAVLRRSNIISDFKACFNVPATAILSQNAECSL